MVVVLTAPLGADDLAQLKFPIGRWQAIDTAAGESGSFKRSVKRYTARMIIDPEEHEVDALLARLPPVDRCVVVEVGCGDGRLTRRYSRHVGTVLAVDPDQAALAAFRKDGIPGNVEVREMPIDRLALPDESVDAVLFSWAL